ncbi:MAG: hypothetical protein IJ300_00155 [Clostridia bacterium]|nr:hypothetical protein [Clostridia bacterium]
MKTIKKIISVLLLATLTFAVMSLTACSSGEVTYKVTVKDALGNPYTSGIIVQFMKNGKQAAMQTVDENGVATKKLEGGTYGIALKFVDEGTEGYYDSDLQVTASKTELDVILTQKVGSEPEALYANGTEHNAYYINTGCTYVDLVAENRNYFLFVPAQAGNYEFSVVDNEDTQIGYYGAPHFVQETSAAEVTDNKFTISVADSMIGTGQGGTAVFVIGVDLLQGGKNNCILAIERIGDAVKTLEDEPWTVYEKTAKLSPYTVPAGATIKEFDLTAPTSKYNLVYNESDGFYHLDSEEGPLVLVRLCEDCQYINCFESMLDRSGVSRYFFDENGDFVKKESYSECLLEYIEYADEKYGVYPLTEDLKYIIQQRGEYAQWWDFESSNFRFQDMNGNNLPEINTEIAWLLMSCYIE